MRKPINKLLILSMLITGAGVLPCDRMEAQAYTFGSQVQTTNTASITYNSGTGQFEYTDAANASLDEASVPLTGAAATLITSTNAWHVSLTGNVAARSMTATASLSPENGMGISVVHLVGLTEYYVSIIGGQVNNTGNAAPDFPANVYGTGAHFLARIGGASEVTTPLGDSVLADGDSILPLSGGTNASAATESVDAVMGMVTLSYDPSTKTVTGYADGFPVGEYAISGWGTNPALTLYVFGASQDISLTSGSDTATNFNAGADVFSVPQLAALHSGTNLVLTWPTNATGFLLQSSSNVTPSAVWSAVASTPVVVNGQNTVTNSMTGRQEFYRLFLP